MVGSIYNTYLWYLDWHTKAKYHVNLCLQRTRTCHSNTAHVIAHFTIQLEALREHRPPLRRQIIVVHCRHMMLSHMTSIDQISYLLMTFATSIYSSKKTGIAASFNHRKFLHKISSQSTHIFLRNVAHRQTDKPKLPKT